MENVRTGISIESSRGRQVIGADELLAGERRIIFCNSEINFEIVNELIAKILYLDSVNHEPITLMISSAGGSIDAGMALYDVMQLVESPMKTIAVGMAYSMGAILLMAGAKGMRYALPHLKIMIHEPLISSGAGGSTSRLKDLADNMLKTKKSMDELIAKHTGKKLKTVEKSTSYDHYFTAEEAMEFGIIDGILKDGGCIYE